MAEHQQAVLGGGCFWCLEAAFEMVEGVAAVTSGYAGGDTENPTDSDIYSGLSGHAEVVRIEFDPAVITYEEILEIFWVIHDPTQLNRQGPDVGTHYRSVIFYVDEVQRSAAEDSKSAVQKLFSKQVITAIEPLDVFYEAEAHHQGFYRSRPQHRYCQVIIEPKLNKLRERFSSRLKASQT